MKKSILTVAALLFMTTGANAMEFDVNCDNQNRQIIFTLTDAGEKPLTVCVSDSQGRIIAIDDTIVTGSEHKAILPIPDNIINGEYYLAVAEDYLAVDDVEGIKIEDRSKEIFISDDELIPQILNELSENDKNDLLDSFNSYYRELDINITDDFTKSCPIAFVAVRGDKEYTQFSEIKNDFVIAKAAAFFTDSKKDVLIEKADVYNDALGIDFDEDYEKCSDELWSVFTKIRTPLKENSDVTEIINEQYEDALAIAMINTSTRDEMDSVLDKYGEAIGLDMSDYDSLKNNVKRMNVVKAIQGKDFESISEVKSAFDRAIKEQNKSTSSNKGSGGGGGGGASSVPSSSTLPYQSGSQNTQQPQEPQKNENTDNQNDNKPQQSEFTFTDINENHWAYQAMTSLYNSKVISGYEDNTIKPDSFVTRAEFVKILTVAMNKHHPDETCGFADVNSDEWYGSYIASAVKEGIVSGYPDNTFNPNGLLSRQDAALMIYKCAELAESDREIQFTDSDSISDYAKEAVLQLAKSGIINGFETGEFRPFENITRAQAAQIIYKLRGE